MKWVGLAAPGVVLLNAVLTAIWFKVVITAALAGETGGGAAATGVVTTRHRMNDNTAAKRRGGRWAAVGVARLRMGPLRIGGRAARICPPLPGMRLETTRIVQSSSDAVANSPVR